MPTSADLNNALVKAADTGQLATINQLLAEGADPDFQESDALRLALLRCHSAIVDRLLPLYRGVGNPLVEAVISRELPWIHNLLPRVTSDQRLQAMVVAVFEDDEVLDSLYEYPRTREAVEAVRPHVDLQVVMRQVAARREEGNAGAKDRALERVAEHLSFPEQWAWMQALGANHFPRLHDRCQAAIRQITVEGVPAVTNDRRRYRP